MKCPKCGEEIPDDIIRKEGARLMSQARKTKRGGFSDPKVAYDAGVKRGGRYGPKKGLPPKDAKE